MANLGVDISGKQDAHFKKTKQRTRSLGPPAKRSKMDVDSGGSLRQTKMLTKPPRNEQGIKDLAVSIILDFEFLLLSMYCEIYIILL